MEPAVRFEGVSKSFGVVQALSEVTFEIAKGSMHAIVGENGAGKTTLMRILYGVNQPNSGTVILGGNPTSFRSSADATLAGVGMVSQHYGIIPELSCIQNLILGSEPSSLLRFREIEDRAEEMAIRMGFKFEWRREAAILSPAGKQKLEILKLLWRKAQVMILDEPTAMLSPSDSDALFESMQTLIGSGATVLLVTHRVREVIDHCDRVSVLRAGKLVADLPVSEIDDCGLSQLIVGGETIVSIGIPQRKEIAGSEPILSLRNLTVKGDRGQDALSKVNLDIRPGEVVGIAGVDGNGQKELMLSIAGVLKPQQGEIQVMGISGSRTRERIRDGLRMIPEDRQLEAAIEEWSIEENCALGLQFLAPNARGPWIDVNERHRFAERVVKRFDTRHGGLRQTMSSLSGGNQQRVVAARSLTSDCKLLIAFQPVRGLDLGASAKIYKAIAESCAEGMAAVIVSFDLDELLTHCHRVLVLYHGTLREPQLDRALDRRTIGDLMVGAA